MKLSGVMRFKGRSKIEDLDIFSWYDYNTELSELMDIFKDVISECKEFQKRYEVKHIKFDMYSNEYINISQTIINNKL